VPISLLNPLEMVKDNMLEQEACPLGDHSKLFREPLVQALLDHLPIPSVKADITISMPISKRFEDKGKLIIAGYASVEVIDSQNELIPIPVLKEAWDNFKKSGFSIGSLMHTNIPVIKVLDNYTDSKGQEWKSGVDDTGLFIVAEVRDDIEKGKQTRELIEKDPPALTGFSIGGEALASEVVCEGSCYTRIDKMELHEIAVVDKPANKPSVFTIVKRQKIQEGENSLKKIKEMTEEEIKAKILALEKEVRQIEEKVWPTPPESKFTPKERKEVEIKMNMIRTEIKAYTMALGQKIIQKMKGEAIGKPFAGYKDFEDCVRQNQQANNPEAYCAAIRQQVEGKKEKKKCHRCLILVAIDKLDRTISKLDENNRKRLLGASFNRFEKAISQLRIYSEQKRIKRD